LPQDVRRFLTGGELTVHSLGEDQTQIMSKTVGETPMPMLAGIRIAENRSHPDLASGPNLYRTNWHIVCPQIERAAASQLEASMVPMAGKDAIFDATAIQRETHVWAAIV
jgi:hypothetical protein